MDSNYTFRLAFQYEIDEIFKLILDRIEWMNDKKIKQWNVTEYDQVYPIDYYEKSRINGELYILESSGTIVAAAVLKETDERWNDDCPSIYLHNFVSRIGVKGAGSLFLDYAEYNAKQENKKYLRLDSDANNKILEEYYESHGYYPIGVCEDGLYRGILRQKEL